VRISRDKLIDLIAASPLIAWFLWQAFQSASSASHEFAAVMHRPSALFALSIVNRLALIAFNGLQIWLFIARPAARGKSDAIAPRLAAMATMAFGIAFFLVPAAQLSAGTKIAATVLTLGGLCMSVYVLSWLGRSFSILPEARSLITRGPYAIVRHPLYAAEAITLLGIAIQYRQPASALLAIAVVAGQIARMGYEESVLSRTFPDYAAYRARTFRVIPFVY
jgi:protein-S-isoprenylcysteine O-methyltransferase Ste14